MLPVPGVTCFDLSMLVLDPVHFGLALLLHGVACPDALALVLDFVHTGSLLPSKSLG